MRLKLIFILLMISRLNCFAEEGEKEYAFADCASAQSKKNCEMQAAEVYKNTGKLFTCRWYPENPNPRGGVCVIIKVNHDDT